MVIALILPMARSKWLDFIFLFLIYIFLAVMMRQQLIFSHFSILYLEYLSLFLYFWCLILFQILFIFLLFLLIFITIIFTQTHTQSLTHNFMIFFLRISLRLPSFFIFHLLLFISY